MRSLIENPPGFRFEPGPHTYWLGDRQVRGVSRILEAGGLKRPFYGRGGNALKLGSQVHLLTEKMDLGQAGRWNWDPRVAAHGPCWSRFREMFPFEILETERPIYSKEHDYAGTPDRVVLVKVGRKWVRAIIEVKTGQEYPWHVYQTAAYAKLARCVLRRIVYLRPGDPKAPLGFVTKIHNARLDWQRFSFSLATAGADALEKVSAA